MSPKLYSKQCTNVIKVQRDGRAVASHKMSMQPAMALSKICCVQAAHNLVVCSYALGDKEGMKTAFEKLLAVPGLAAEQDDDAEEDEDDDYADDTAGYKRQDSRVPSAGLKGPGLLGHGDGLKDQMRKKQAYIKK